MPDRDLEDFDYAAIETRIVARAAELGEDWARALVVGSDPGTSMTRLYPIDGGPAVTVIGLDCGFRDGDTVVTIGEDQNYFIVNRPPVTPVKGMSRADRRRDGRKKKLNCITPRAQAKRFRG